VIRAFIVAASPLVRAGLVNILAAQGVKSSGAFPSVELLADYLDEREADVVVVDVSAEQFETVLGAIHQLELTSAAAVVLLADHPAPRFLAEAMRTGIGAILPTDASAEQLVAAMQAAMTGLVVMHRDEIDSTYPEARPAFRPFAELPEPLTPREREVLQMLASGLANKEIATRLTISEHTVKFHVASILGKLGAASRTEAVALGIRHGLVLL
jgi:NarL family two-component system response regulator YdfI